MLIHIMLHVFCTIFDDNVQSDWEKQAAFDEIDEMIATVDRNGDGRISYSEFRS